MDSSTSSEQTARVISSLGGFAIVAGSMLGIGIFLSPSIVAANVHSTPWFFLVWALGGLTALAGAVACAELGAMIPRAGGDYVFQYEAFGPSVAFASGCVLFGAIFCGSIATMSVGLCTYQLPALTGYDFGATATTLPLLGSITWAQIAAIALVLVLTIINGFGALPSTRTQDVLTLLPVAALVALALYAVLGGHSPEPPANPAPATASSIFGFVTAYMAVYFAYSGWINIIYVAGEVKDPGRNIPLSLIGGTLAITALYLLLCSGFIRVLGLDGVREAGEVGTAVAGTLLGTAGKLLVTAMIGAALIASVNATVLGGARVAYAMARRGALWSWLGSVGTHRVPLRALWLQAALSCVLVLSGRFEQLYTMVSLAMVVTGSLTVASVFVLRATRQSAERPYRATGYPWLPAFYVASSVLVVAVMVREAFAGAPGARQPLLGLAILIAAYLAHRAFARPSP